MAEPPDPEVVAKAAIPYSEFLELKEKGTFDNVLKVVLHHTEGSIKVPQKEIFPELLRLAGLTGGFVSNFHCSTINFIKEKGKNAKKLVIFCKSEEVAKKIISLGTAELFGHSIAVSDNEFEKKAIATETVVHTAIKKIEVSGFNVNTVAMLIEILRGYAEFEDSDIMVSREALRLSITVKKFKKIVPLKSSFSKGDENHTYFLKTSGYDPTEVRSALADKPKMADLFEKNNEKISAPKADTWLNSYNPIKPKKNPSRVLICNYCGTPGHAKRQCPKLDDFLAKLTCYNCGGKGHTSHTCPKPSTKGQKLCYSCNEPGHFAWQKNKCKKYDENNFFRERFSRGVRRNNGRSRNPPTIDLTKDPGLIEASTPNVFDEGDENEEGNSSSSSDSTTKESSSSASNIDEKSVVEVSQIKGAEEVNQDEEVKVAEKAKENDEGTVAEPKEVTTTANPTEAKVSEEEANNTADLMTDNLQVNVSEKENVTQSSPGQKEVPSSTGTVAQPVKQVPQTVTNNFQPTKESKLKSTKPITSTTLAKEVPLKKSEQSSKTTVKSVRANLKENKSSIDKKNKDDVLNKKRPSLNQPDKPNLRQSTVNQSAGRNSSSSGRSRNKSGKNSKVTLGDFQKAHGQGQQPNSSQ